MPDENGTETTRSDAPSVDESLFGDAADDTEAAVADEQDANEETEQDPQGADDADEQDASKEVAQDPLPRPGAGTGASRGRRRPGPPREGRTSSSRRRCGCSRDWALEPVGAAQ